jgi:hypothetical protein
MDKEGVELVAYKFYWRCQICKNPIENNLIERWVDGRKARYHKECIEKQEALEREADRILRRRN